MFSEQNKALIRRYFEAISGQDKSRVGQRVRRRSRSARAYRQPHVQRIAVVLAIFVLSGCAAKTERTFVAASESTVSARLESTYSGEGAYVVVLNASTVDVVVTSVTLRDCANIKNRCETVRLRVPLAPGQRRQVLTVTRADPNQGHSFRYSFSWEAPDALPAIPGL